VLKARGTMLNMAEHDPAKTKVNDAFDGRDDALTCTGALTLIDGVAINYFILPVECLARLSVTVTINLS
jgi:hypothetical protein